MAREIHMKDAAFTLFAVDGNKSATLFHDSVDRSQPQSRSLPHPLGAEEWLKKMFQDFLTHSRT